MDTSNSTPQISPRAPVDMFPSGESRVSDHIRKFRLWRKFTDGFDEILVRRAVARQDGAHERDHGERILVVCSADVFQQN